MQIVKAGVPFNFNYPVYDQNPSLNVLASVYDVTSGTPVFVIDVMMVFASAAYSGNFTPVAGKTYLVIVLVYTDNTFDTIDTTREPWTDCYQEATANGSLIAFNYGAFDLSSSLYVKAKIFNTLSGVPVLAGSTPMAHVLGGVYFGSFASAVGNPYLVTKTVYVDSGYTNPDLNRAPGADSFQADQFGLASIDPGIINVRAGIVYEIDGESLTGVWQPFTTTANGIGDVPDIAIANLAQFIRTNLTALTVKEEWPYANEKLDFPALTISSIDKPKRMPQYPYPVSDPILVDGMLNVNMLVATWDFQLQLDVWCRSKLERKQYTDAIIALFNSQEIDQTPDGLSLTVTNYFSEIFRFEIQDIMCVDDEAAAQRQERREKITVLVNCNEIRVKKYYAMNTIQTFVGTENTDDDTSETEQHDVT